MSPNSVYLTPGRSILCSDGLPFLEGERVRAGADDDGIALQELSLEDAHRQRVEHPPLDRALEGPRAVRRIVPFTDELLLRRVRQLHVDLPLLEPFHQAADLDIDDLLQVVAPEGVEEDDLVDPVQELRAEQRCPCLQHPPLRAFADRASVNRLLGEV